jgi:hypothetical protein
MNSPKKLLHIYHNFFAFKLNNHKYKCLKLEQFSFYVNSRIGSKVYKLLQIICLIYKNLYGTGFATGLDMFKGYN